jgi:hypothetical protein
VKALLAALPDWLRDLLRSAFINLQRRAKAVVLIWRHSTMRRALVRFRSMGRFVFSSGRVPYELFIVAIGGQSNASGQGPLPPGNVLYPRRHAERLFCFTRGGRWLPVFEPMHSHEAKFGGSLYPILENNPIGIGPGMFFAEALADHISGRLIGMVPLGVGARLSAYALSDDTRTICGATHQLLESAKQRGEIKAYLFVQGESDTLDLADAHAWAARFTTHVGEIRRRHGNDMVVIFARLGKNPNLPAHPHWDVVREQQTSVDMPGVHMIETDDLEKQPDGLHYTNPGYEKLGQHMALKLASILSLASEIDNRSCRPLPEDDGLQSSGDRSFVTTKAPAER